MAALLPCFQLLLLLLASAAAAGPSLPVPPAVCMPGMTAPFLLRQALPFCGGGTLGSATCCTVEVDAKLHQKFMEDVKNHDYYGHDPHCTSTVKAIICAVCVPSALADDPFSSTSNTTTATNKNSSLPLHCAGAATATPSISTKDLDSSGSTSPTTEPPTPEWLLPDDTNDAPTIPKWLIALLSALATLLGGFVTYKICKAICECECGNNIQFCSNNECCLCCV